MTEPKHGNGCSRVNGECVNLHCPVCGEPCGLYGHPKCLEVALAKRLVDEAHIAVSGVVGEVSDARGYAVAATVAVLRELTVSAFDPARLAALADEVERAES